MCDICLHAPCLSGCPNAPEPPMVFVCSGCGGPIYHDDWYWEIMGEQYCEQCMEAVRKVAEYDPD